MQKISQSKDVNKPRERGKGRRGESLLALTLRNVHAQVSSATGQLCLFHLSFERERERQNKIVKCIITLKKRSWNKICALPCGWTKKRKQKWTKEKNIYKTADNELNGAGWEWKRRARFEFLILGFGNFVSEIRAVIISGL